MSTDEQVAELQEERDRYFRRMCELEAELTRVTGKDWVSTSPRKGRPLAIDETKQAAVLSYIKGGATRKAACAAAGVSDRVLREYIRKAKRGMAEYVPFVRDLEAAEGLALGHGQQTIFRAGNESKRKPYCGVCRNGPVTELTCKGCGEPVPLRCPLDDCGRPLQVEVPGDWRAMDKWMSKAFPTEWGDRINLDVQGQLRSYLVACREEFEDEPGVFRRMMHIAMGLAGTGVEPPPQLGMASGDGE